MQENQRVDVGECERMSNLGSLPSDAGEMTGLHQSKHEQECGFLPVRVVGDVTPM